MPSVPHSSAVVLPPWGEDIMQMMRLPMDTDDIHAYVDAIIPRLLALPWQERYMGLKLCRAASRLLLRSVWALVHAADGDRGAITQAEFRRWLLEALEAEIGAVPAPVAAQITGRPQLVR